MPQSQERQISSEIKKPAADQPSERRVYRDQDRKLLQRSRTIHALLYKSLLQPKGESALEEIDHLEEIESLEIMSIEDPSSQELLGVADEEESGINATSRVEFKDSRGRDVVAYMKPAAGETAFDPEGYPMRYDPETGKRVRWEGSEPEPIMTALMSVWHSEEYFSKYVDGLRAKYGIPDEEAAAFEAQLREEMGVPRLGIEPGGGAVREKVVYDQAKMLGFSVVQPTTLRRQTEQVMEKGAMMERVVGLASVQEAVCSKDTGEPGRELYQEEISALLLKPSSEWPEALGMSEEQVEKLKESLIEAASLHWLTGQLDGHSQNMLLLDDGSLKVIDNGLSYSKKRDVDVKYKKIPLGLRRNGLTEMGDDTKTFSQFRSVPMEILAQNPELKLSDEKRGRLSALYNSVIGQGGPEKEVLEQMFKMLFPNLKVARGEMGSFLKRLDVLVQGGRPPAEAFSEKELFSIGTFTLQHTKTKEEAITKKLAKLKTKSVDSPDVTV